MGDHVLLVPAEEGDELVAGALNLIGGDTLYGCLWGCLPHAYYPNLHFEACYYQAIDAAIELNLDKVEAGTQCEHKIQRGYLPVKNYSLHYILDEDFKKVLPNFLVRESVRVGICYLILVHSRVMFLENMEYLAEGMTDVFCGMKHILSTRLIKTFRNGIAS